MRSPGARRTLPSVRPLGADQQPQQRALARAVRPDDGHDLAAVQRQVDAGEHPLAAERRRRGRAPRSARSRRRLPAAGAEALGLDHRALDARSRPRAASAARPRAGRASGVSATRRQARQTRKRRCAARRRGCRRRRRRAARCGARSRWRPGSRARGRPPAAGCRARPPPAAPAARRRSSPGAIRAGSRARRPAPASAAAAARRRRPRPPPAPGRGSRRWSCGRNAAGSGSLDGAMCYFITGRAGESAS